MTIVCATDFSQPARDALAVAAQLSSRLKQELVLIHVVVPQPADPVVADFEPLRSAMAEALEHQAGELRRTGSKITTRAVTGWPEEEIVRAAREVEADLIVMGALGRHRAPHWLIGSVAERVAQTTTVPLLLVRDGKPLESWIGGKDHLRVLAATDFTPVSDFALDWMQFLKGIGPCDVILEYVANPAIDAARLNLRGPISHKHLHPIADEVIHRELARRASCLSLGGPTSTVVKLSLDEPGSEIAKTAEEEKVGLVVVGTHQRGFAERIAHPRVSRDVVHTTRANVLCVPFHTPDERFRALEAPKIRTILAATDFSACGNHAVAWAMAIAPAKSKVVICNVARDATERAKASEALGQIEHPRSWPDNVEVAVDVATNGGVAKAIWAQAQICDADIVVVGAHGESGLRAMLGSVARDLIAVSAKPVLVVRDEARD